MKINLLIILISLSLNLKAQVNVTAIGEAVKTYVQKANFNGRIILWDNDKIVLDHIQGYASFERNQLIDSLTCFNVASVGKMITPLGILKLVDEEKLKLEDEINSFYPNLPSKITVEQLLNHTSGLQKRTFVLGNNWKNLGESIAVDQFIEFLSKEPIRFAAGEKFEYNNVNYILLYDLHTKVAGRTIEEELAQQELLTTLQQTNRANRYDYNEATGQWIHDVTMVGNFLASYEYDLLGPGHYFMNPSEAVRIIDAFKGSIPENLLINATTSGTETDKEMEKYGYGIALKKYSKDREIWYHLGKNHGSRSYLAHFKEQNLTLFMVTNTADPNFNMLSPQLESMITESKSFEMPELSIANELAGDIPYLGSNEIIREFFNLKMTDEYYVSRTEINDIAFHLWEQDQKKKGIELLAINAMEFPDNHRARYYYAEGLQKLGDYSKAVLEYEETIKIMVDHLGENHGWVTQTRKQLEECETLVNNEAKTMEELIEEMTGTSNQLQIQASKLEQSLQTLRAQNNARQ